MTSEDRPSGINPSREMPGMLDFVEVFDALDRRDDAALWQVARLARSQEDFFDLLRAQAGTTRYTTRHPTRARDFTNHHCALLLVPMVLPAPTAAEMHREDVFAAAIANTRQWIAEWWQHKVDVRLFNVPIGYWEVAEWSPAVMRDKLDQLSINRLPSLSVVERYDVQLPEEAPALAFFVAAVQQPIEPISIPPCEPGMLSSLVARLTGAVRLAAPGSAVGGALVGQPAFASEAILQGLLAWLSELDRSHGIYDWEPTPVSENTVILAMTLGEGTSLATQIPLHAHQLGMQGISTVLNAVRGFVEAHACGLSRSQKQVQH